MKSILVYDQTGDQDITFALVDGDWSRFNGINVNDDTELAKELNAMLFGDKKTQDIVFEDDLPFEQMRSDVKVVAIGTLKL